MTFPKLFLAAALLLPALAAVAAEPKLEATLIWATSETAAPNGKLKAVDADVQKKLASLPLKWTKFYEMNRETFSPADQAAKESKRVVLSDKCTLEVRHVEGDAAPEPIAKIMRGKRKPKMMTSCSRESDPDKIFVNEICSLPSESEMMKAKISALKSTTITTAARRLVKYALLNSTSEFVIALLAMNLFFQFG